jgi:4-amino-4-deoxy-L-arabinose transferase-like glycosyltransferase
MLKNYSISKNDYSEVGFSHFGSDFKNIFTKDLKFIIPAFLFTIILHIILWISYPIHYGPDGHTYIYYFVDIFNKEAILPMILTYRTPVAPFFYGTLLMAGGTLAVTIASEILLLLLIPVIYLLALSWGRNASRVATALFILFIPFHIQFHQISSDALFSFFIIIFFLSFKYAIEYKNAASWAALGLISALTILTRPSGLVIILALPAVLFLKIDFKKILKLAGVYLLCVIAILGSFVLYKGVRFEDYTISRGSNYTAFMRVYSLQESLFSPENGPASEKLVSIIEEELLHTELYKKYDITLDKILNYQPGRRFLGDIIVAVDKAEGWDSQYELLEKVAFESIKANPASYFKHYLKDIILLTTIDQTIPGSPVPVDTKLYLNNIENIAKENLPEPTEGELIPFSNTWWMLSSPDNKLPTQSEVDNFNQKYEKIASDVENAEGSPVIARIIELLWDNVKIPIFYFWVLGILGIILSKRNKRILFLYIFIISAIIIVGTLYAAHVYTRYRLPLDPLIMISGVAGFFMIIKKIKKIIN